MERNVLNLVKAQPSTQAGPDACFLCALRGLFVPNSRLLVTAAVNARNYRGSSSPTAIAHHPLFCLPDQAIIGWCQQSVGYQKSTIPVI